VARILQPLTAALAGNQPSHGCQPFLLHSLPQGSTLPGDNRPFQLWTDHKPLIFALNRVLPLLFGCQQRHLIFISEYMCNLVYVPGMSNVVVDALSQPTYGIADNAATPDCAAIAGGAPFNLRDMALHQTLCPQVQSLPTSKELRIVTQKVGDLDLLGDAATNLL
jgi:hypothetical protein